MDSQTIGLNNAWRYAFMALVRHCPAHTDSAETDASVSNLICPMGLLDDAPQRSAAFVTGGNFTLADAVLGLDTHRWYATPMRQPALSAVAPRYYDKPGERPACLRHGRNGLP
jgi:glutathione S-transferase